MFLAMSDDSFNSEQRSIVRRLHKNEYIMKYKKIQCMTHSSSSYFMPFKQQRHTITPTSCAQALVLLASCLVFLFINLPNSVNSLHIASPFGDERYHAFDGAIFSSKTPTEYARHNLVKRSLQIASDKQHQYHHHHQHHHHHHNNNHHHHQQSKDSDITTNSLPSTQTFESANLHQHHHHSFGQHHRQNLDQYQIQTADEDESHQTQHEQPFWPQEEIVENIDSNKHRIQEQVPEQLSIVVNSNSDNSYVSASPIESSSTDQEFDHNDHQSEMQQQLHQHVHAHNSGHHKKHTKSWLNKKSNLNKDQQHGKILDIRYSSDHIANSVESANHAEQLDDQQHLGRGDISTTATTTPRNNVHKIRQQQQSGVQIKSNPDLNSDNDYSFIEDEDLSSDINDNESRVSFENIIASYNFFLYVISNSYQIFLLQFSLLNYRLIIQLVLIIVLDKLPSSKQKNLLKMEQHFLITLLLPISMLA